MKFKFLFLNVLFCCIGFSQANQKITTIETVEILNNNKEEAIYYFQNNWETLRAAAVKKGYIHSYALLLKEHTKETPFQIILITTYLNKELHEKREVHFAELIEASGGLKLLNEKKPSEFRKSVFGIDTALHL